MMRSSRGGCLFFGKSMLALAMGAVRLCAQHDQLLRQQLLKVSHSTRMNEPEMKPWYMKVLFRLNNQNGELGESGTLEEWWMGPQRWKLSVETPSYRSTSIENETGDFRTAATPPIPPQIRAIEGDLTFPAPMSDDLTDLKLNASRTKVDETILNCIQISEKRASLHFPSYCLSPVDQNLSAIEYQGFVRLIRRRITIFQGRSIALTVFLKRGSHTEMTAEITELRQIRVDESVLTPTSDMKAVEDIHTIRMAPRK